MEGFPVFSRSERRPASSGSRSISTLAATETRLTEGLPIFSRGNRRPASSGSRSISTLAAGERWQRRTAISSTNRMMSGGAWRMKRFPIFSRGDRRPASRGSRSISPLTATETRLTEGLPIFSRGDRRSTSSGSRSISTLAAGERWQRRTAISSTNRMMSGGAQGWCRN
jgi:hypothetical protein